jgi:hypothetical protein
MVSQTQYDAFKKQALDNQPIRKTVSLVDLRFVTMDCVEYSGLKLGLSREALKNLLKIVGISLSGIEDLNASIGEDGAQKMLNTIKNAIGSNNKTQVTLVVSPDRIITRIAKENQSSLISANTYFETFDRLANVHNLDIKDMSFNKENGNIYINSLANRNGEYQVANMKDEVFRTGMAFSRTMDGILAEPYLDRMVCTNGMVTRAFDESFRLHNMTPRSWQDFYEHMEKIEKSGFVPEKFATKVIEAAKTPASLLELERGLNLIKNHAKIEDADLEMFIRGTKNTYNRLHGAGIDTEKLNNGQKSNVRTGLMVWDVINGVTDFASHNYGFEKKPNADRIMQVQAGDMLTRTFDTSNIVMNQPF